jgi:feruloyl esterase
MLNDAMKSLTVLLVVPIAALLHAQGPGRGAPPPPEIRPKNLLANPLPTRTCESLTTVALPNTTIDSAALDPADGSCRITATVTHPPTGDQIKVWIGIPMKDWNGRFEGTGGGGFSGGSPNGIRQPLTLGYAAGATDTGHTSASGSFVLDSTGHLNWQLLRDNAYLGIHEMTVTGKALTQALYSTEPREAYFVGCSTGGRQALSEVQRYPEDYNGVVAGAPATNWTKLHIEQMWGNLTMQLAGNFVPQCKLDAATNAAIAACDMIDGVQDGVIEDPLRCNFDPKVLIGTTAGDCGTFTESDANVIRAIWEGPKRRDGGFLWYGLTRGASFAGLSAPNAPNPITLEWWRFFLNQNPQWDWHTLTRESYENYWTQSVEEFSAVIATDNPDIAAFRDRGGKLILWHGLADQLIYPQGTMDYYKRVQQQMGGADKASAFARLFLAPGVGHCGGGVGPQPGGQLDALVHWVEDGKAPETLQATKRDQTGAPIRTRPMCQYPLVAKYKGSGSTDEASNFTCSTNF